MSRVFLRRVYAGLLVVLVITLTMNCKVARNYRVALNRDDPTGLESVSHSCHGDQVALKISAHGSSLMDRSIYVVATIQITNNSEQTRVYQWQGNLARTEEYGEFRFGLPIVDGQETRISIPIEPYTSHNIQLDAIVDGPNLALKGCKTVELVLGVISTPGYSTKCVIPSVWVIPPRR